MNRNIGLNDQHTMFKRSYIFIFGLIGILYIFPITTIYLGTRKIPFQPNICNIKNAKCIIDNPGYFIYTSTDGLLSIQFNAKASFQTSSQYNNYNFDVQIELPSVIDRYLYSREELTKMSNQAYLIGVYNNLTSINGFTCLINTDGDFYGLNGYKEIIRACWMISSGIASMCLITGLVVFAICFFYRDYNRRYKDYVRPQIIQSFNLVGDFSKKPLITNGTRQDESQQDSINKLIDEPDSVS